MSPVFAHGRLRLYILSLLDESPKHGYELIQALSERFGGTYSPSAGTIYPRLAKLEEEGLVTKSADGRKTVYEITEAGRAELDSRASELDDIESEMSDSIRRLADEVRSGVNDAMRSLRADLASAARDARATFSTAAEQGAGATWGSSTGSAPGHRDDGSPDTRDHESGSSTHRAPSDPTGFSSRQGLQEADALLTGFRAEIRAELRTAASRDALTPEALTALRSALDTARETVRRTIG